MAAQELFTTGLFNDASLQAYYRLENVNDSKNSYNLTNINTVAFNAAKFNNGADAGSSNTNKCLAIASTVGVANSNTNVSISFWIKLNTEIGSGDNDICKLNFTTNNVSYIFRYSYNGGTRQLNFWRVRELIAVDGFTYNITLGTSSFHHIVMTWDGTNVRGYVDGSLVGSPSAASGNGSGSGSDTFSLLANYPSYGFTSAIMDDTAVFSRVLTASEITNLYNGGMGFDVAANSGDQAAASSYSGSASWAGTNRALCVDVSMLGPGVTVTSMTYGGANCTFIGSKSTVTSLGGVECWRILSSDAGAPAAGANTLAITLSSSLEFTVEWASYIGVHQTSPTEGFNSAQATNAGSATDASVAITTVADNDWVHAAVVANDTSITAGNTTRNNIAGTLGSGANEDNGAPKTPAGSVTMNYSGMGITTTWAIAGYALRDINASTLATASPRFRSLLGVGI